MSKLRNRVGRAALRLSAVMAILGLPACAVEQAEFQAAPPTEVAINAEDVEQIAIQEVSARERAARRARACEGSSRSRIGCDSEQRVDVEQIFGPYD